MFRLLVAGGRNYYDYRFIELTLENWLDEVEGQYSKDGLTLIHGDAAGVDRIAAQWAKYNSFIVEPHVAKWKELGRTAGIIRNTEMVQSGIDYAILFPGGIGTANMQHQLQKAGIAFRQVLDPEYKQVVY